MYTAADVGLAKVDALRARALSINPAIDAIALRSDITGLGEERLTELVQDHDVVVSATDDMMAQELLNAFAWHAGTPAIFPAIYRGARAGEVVMSVPREGGVCWRCAVLGSIAHTDGERPHDYGTGRLVAATALGADVWTVSAAAAKLALALLHVTARGDGPLATFIGRPLAWGSTLLQFATSPAWAPFDSFFGGVPGQWAYQSVWMTPTGDKACPVCGSEPTQPRISRVLRADDRLRLLRLIDATREASEQPAAT